MLEQLRDQLGVGVPVLQAVGAEQHDAVAVPPVVVGVVPDPFGVEPDQRLGPAGAVEVRPLVGEAQVDLDDAARRWSRN